MNWHGTVVEETILKFSQYRILPPVSRHQKVLPSLCFLVLGSAEGEIAESSSHSICDVFCCGNRICSVSGWMRANRRFLLGHGYSNDKCIVCGKNLTYGHLTPYCHVHLKEKQNTEKINHWLKTGDTGCGISTTLRNGIRQYILDSQDGKCAICGLPQTWDSKPLKFILDHINGDASNNNRNNLRLICPNCDSQLDTYKSKNHNSARTYRKST